jgi:hypothetical protein
MRCIQNELFKYLASLLFMRARYCVVNANPLFSRRVQARDGNTFNLVDILSNGAAIIFDIGIATGTRRILGSTSFVHFRGIGLVTGMD